MKRNYYIYLTWDTEKNKFYLGKRSTTRNINDDPYVGSGNVILNIKKKYKNDKEYLKNRLVKVILEISKNEKENAENEIKWCDFFNVTENNYFYNIAGGGTGGHTIAGYTPEQRKKFGEAVSKRNKGKFTGKDNPMYGKGLSGSANGMYGKVGLRGSANGMYGKPAHNRGVKPKPETIEKLKAIRGEKASFYGKKHTQEYKDYMSKLHSGENNPVAKKVILVNTGEVFVSAMEAKRKYGIDNSSIGRCCMGKSKYAGKVNGEEAIWRYVE